MKKINTSRILTRDEARERILHDIPCTDYLEKALRGGYICIYCGSGKGPHGTGAVKYYGNTNTCACFACPDAGKMGHKFDVLDLIQHYEHCDYSTALKIGADKLGYTITGYSKEPAGGYDIHRLTLDPVQDRQTATGTKDGETGAGTTESPQRATEPAETADYADYYMECMQRLDDPAALSYLSARGISIATAQAYKVGYDPQADPANAPGAVDSMYRPHPCPRVIIPVKKDHYVARSIDPNTPAAYRVLNPNTKHGAGSPGIFNGKAIFSNRVVFVTEGVFDALSIIECGGVAIATNSANNTKALTEKLKQKKTVATLILCPDNDEDPATRERVLKRFNELADSLQALGVKCVIRNITGAYKDVNDALRADRPALEAAIREAIAQAEALPDPGQDAPQKEDLPGLLTYDGAVNLFETADHETIEIKSFPEFSKIAKIRKHDSVVIAADTGVGKSSLAINFMYNLSEKYPCMYINLEMDTIDVLERLVAIHSGMELDRVEGYQKDKKTAAAVNAAVRAIAARKPIQVIEGAYFLEDLQEIIEKSTEGRKEPTAVFIDHSLLMDTKTGSAGRYDRFTQLSEGLRKMALSHNIILFILLQQSRAGKAVEDERPKNSSLKESGSWENDATQICFLWWDAAVKRKKLIITKNRHGDTGEFTLNYWPKTQTYIEAKDQRPAVNNASMPAKQTRREKQREKLINALEIAYANTDGHPHLLDIAEAADVTTATVKGWIKEYGGCIIDGIQQDPAGIETEVEYTGVIKLTPAEDEENPFKDTADDSTAPAKRKRGL